jgi:hypothetical protein
MPKKTAIAARIESVKRLVIRRARALKKVDEESWGMSSWGIEDAHTALYEAITPLNEMLGIKPKPRPTYTPEELERMEAEDNAWFEEVRRLYEQERAEKTRRLEAARAKRLNRQARRNRKLSTLLKRVSGVLTEGELDILRRKLRVGNE